MKKTIDAFLCPRCRDMLRPWAHIDPLGDPEPEARVCPWCSRKTATRQYRLAVETATA